MGQWSLEGLWSWVVFDYCRRSPEKGKDKFRLLNNQPSPYCESRNASVSAFNEAVISAPGVKSAENRLNI